MPNTYVMTKAAAEQLIKHEAKNLPVSIFRPAIGRYLKMLNIMFYKRVVGPNHIILVIDQYDFERFQHIFIVNKKKRRVLKLHNKQFGYATFQ